MNSKLYGLSDCQINNMRVELKRQQRIRKYCAKLTSNTEKAIFMCRHGRPWIVWNAILDGWSDQDVKDFVLIYCPAGSGKTRREK